MKIIHSESLKTNQWSGGRTTQLYIYPESSEFKKLDFSFRISLATIEQEQSVFTPLPKVNRHFMLLDGNVKLSHNKHHQTRIKPFELDNFIGDWETHCQLFTSKAEVFNLMTNGEIKSKFRIVDSIIQESYNHVVNTDFLICFVPKGDIIFKDKTIPKNSTLIFNKNESVNLKLNNDTKIIVVEIDK